MDGDNLNSVLGVIQRRTVFDHLVCEDCTKFLRELMRPALLVSEAWGGHQLLDRLMAERQHLAVVSGGIHHSEMAWASIIAGRTTSHHSSL